MKNLLFLLVFLLFIVSLSCKRRSSDSKNEVQNVSHFDSKDDKLKDSQKNVEDRLAEEVIKKALYVDNCSGPDSNSQGASSNRDTGNPDDDDRPVNCHIVNDGNCFKDPNTVTSSSSGKCAVRAFTTSGMITADFPRSIPLATDGKCSIGVTESGTFRSFEFADCYCDYMAYQAGLLQGCNRFVAWLSGEPDPSKNPNTTPADLVDIPQAISTGRVDDLGTSYYRMDGVIIANDHADLIDGNIENPIQVNEFGALLASNVNLGLRRVWTGTHTDGMSYIEYGRTRACANWTNQTPSAPFANEAYYGDYAQTGKGWTNEDANGCFNDFHLYCFERFEASPYLDTIQPQNLCTINPSAN
ncbi:MAG: hypothetical protein KC505_07365 [Myxococcales bacterium]|nr:hypothetical protein [Myxococcales bacterium]USN50458.1 MAG: hypothetical protein H6731_09380 [Myxococcales bacterium]